MIRTVAEIEGVTQFMDSLFDNPLEKYTLGIHGREAFFQSIEGYNAGSSTQLCFSVNMGENGYEKVHMGYGKRLECTGRCLRGQLLQNHCGIVLIAPRIKGEIHVLKEGHDLGGIAVYPSDFTADRVVKFCLRISNGGYEDGMSR